MDLILLSGLNVSSKTMPSYHYMHRPVGIKIYILAEDIKLTYRFMIFTKKNPRCILNTEALKYDAQ